MTITSAPTHRLPAQCCELGEGPQYDATSDTAWWFDIVGQKLLEHRFGGRDMRLTDVHGRVIREIVT